MLTSYTLGKLFKEEFIEFLRSIKDICIKNHPEQLNIQLQVDTIVTIVDKLDDTLVYERESNFTKILEQLDLERDDVITGIKHGFLMNLYHDDPAHKDAARLLLDHLEGYGKRIIKLNYEAESTVLINIMQDYKTNDHLKMALKTVDLWDWAQRIDRTNTAFRVQYRKRITAESATENISFSTLKPTAIKVYDKLVHRLNAYIEIDDIGKYNTIKSELDMLSDRYQQIVKKRTGTTTDQTAIENTNSTNVEDTYPK